TVPVPGNGVSRVFGPGANATLAGAVDSAADVLGIIYSPHCFPPPAGLVSWWKAEDNALDSVGANSGLLQNGAGFSAGEVGDSFSLDGADDYVLVHASPSLNVGLGNGLTIEGWINPDNVAIQMPIAEYERDLGTFDG